MQSVAAIQARPAAVAVRPARRQSVRVMAASAGQEAPKQKNAALVTLAAFAAAALLNAAPAQADVKSVVCASNATAKICLKNSAKK
eukprot:jgi/Picsp_1/3609/NSC_06446-R1_---NA---